MHRFYLTPNEWNAEPLVLRGTEAHHARDVLRLQPDDRLTLFDGAGREALATIEAFDSRAVHLRVMQEARNPPPACRIGLAQAIPKGKNMDLIVQKAVEIGATEIFPLLTARTVIHLEEKQIEQKRSKWQQIAIEAAKQCGQNWLPRVFAPTSPNEFFLAPDTPKFDLCLIGSLQSDAQHLRKVLTNYRQSHCGARPANVLMMIGPEGDFTPAEIALARTHGCYPITFGPIVLRVETAAIYCLSVLSYELLLPEVKETA